MQRKQKASLGAQRTLQNRSGLSTKPSRKSAKTVDRVKATDVLGQAHLALGHGVFTGRRCCRSMLATLDKRQKPLLKWQVPSTGAASAC